MLESLWLGLSALWSSGGDTLYEGNLHIPRGEYEIALEQSWNSISLFTADGSELPEIEIWKDGQYVSWERDHHSPHLSELYFAPDDQESMVIRSSADFEAIVHAIDLDETLEFEAAAGGSSAANSAHQFFSDDFRGRVPRYYTRSAWGADESLRAKNFRRKMKDFFGFRTMAPEAKKLPSKYQPKIVERKNAQGQTLTWPIEKNQVIKKIVVHHTAEHVDERRSPMQLMRAVYYYHTKTKGWGDIGYNFVIDAHGNIYEGRAGGPQAVGAHTAYHNVGTIGVALMGNFQHENPTPYQQKSLEILIADQALRFGINPEGQGHFLHTLSSNISGHQDVAVEGHGTACPGKNLHALLPEIRKNAVQILALLEDKIRTSTRDRIGRKSKVAPKVRGKIKRDTAPDFELAQILKRKVFRRGEKSMLEIKVRNNTNKTWAKGSTVRVRDVPEGMRVGHFRSVEPIGAGFTGIFRTQATVDSTPNGQYELTLEEAILDAKSSEQGLFFPLQVSGERKSIVKQYNTTKNVVVSRKSKNQVQRRVQASTFQKPSFDTNKKQDTTHQKRRIENPTKEFGPHVKIKLSYFDEDFALASSKDWIKISEREKTIASVPPQTPITIIPDGQKFLVRTEDGDAWIISDPVLRTFSNQGVLKISNYNRKLGAIAYNQFRFQLNFHKDDAGKMFIVNELPLERYLWGLAEEPTSEPLEKKHAIFVLARSYVYVYGGWKRKFGTELYDLEDSPRTSQFYLGYDWERYHHEQKAIVGQTFGELMTVNGQPVIGPYFTQSAGYSVNPWYKQYPWAKVQELPYDQGLQQKGHGVGLSGNSSRILAEKGQNYHQIIDYFFEGVEVEKKY